MKKIITSLLTGMLLASGAAAQQRPPQRQNQPLPRDAQGVPQGYVKLDPNKPLSTDFLLVLEKQKNIELQFELAQQALKKEFEDKIAPIQAAAQKQSDSLTPFINSSIVTIKKENGWGNDVTFDLATNLFIKKLPDPSDSTPKPHATTLPDGASITPPQSGHSQGSAVPFAQAPAPTPEPEAAPHQPHQ